MVDRIFGGGPGCAETNGTVGFINTVVVGVAVFGAELFQYAIRHDGENLVGGGFHHQLHAGGLQAILQAGGHLVGMAAHLPVQIVGEQSVKLHAQKPALGQHAAVALDHVAEVALEGGVRDDHGFTEKEAHFGAANVEYVAVLGQMGQAQALIRRQRVAQAGAVHE